MELVNPGLTGVPGGVTVGHSFVCRIYVTKDDDLWQFLFFFFFFSLSFFVYWLVSFNCSYRCAAPRLLSQSLPGINQSPYSLIVIVLGLLLRACVEVGEGSWPGGGGADYPP